MAVGATLRLDRLHSCQGDISGRRDPKKVFTQGQGHFLYDEGGVAYLDFQLCNGAAPFGYANQDHLTAINTQSKRLSGLASEFLSPERAALAHALCGTFRKSFGCNGRVHFTVGGAQAVDDALKLCARMTGRTKVLAMEGGYHGRTIAASSVSASYRYRSGFGYGRTAELTPFPYCNRCPYGMKRDDCDIFCLSQVERLFASEAAGVIDGNGNLDIGAIFIESVLGRGGHVAMPPEYLRGLRTLADRHGLLLVIDDIQMGFFRTGRMWTAEHAGITPDVVLFGKALSNGMFPVSGFWSREGVADEAAWPVGSSHATFSASPIGMALGLATLKALSDPELPSNIERVGQKIEATLVGLQRSFPLIWAVNRKGLALSLDIQDPKTGAPSPEFAHAIVEAALAAPYAHDGQRFGLVTTHGGMHNHMVMLAPPYRTTDDDIYLFEKILSAALAQVWAHQ